MDERANPRAAIVFGGSRGIGAAAARRLAADGFSVALTYVSRPDSAGEVVAGIEAAGGRATAIEADSGDPAAWRARSTSPCRGSACWTRRSSTPGSIASTRCTPCRWRSCS